MRERGKNAFLDVCKAFDTVWHQGLLVKLFNKGVKGHLWRYINNSYKCARSSVRWTNTTSKSFPINQGVSQGGTLSPYLYCVFVDELLDILTESEYGVS